MKLIIGLGNPGREYVGTRHNVGFEVIDALAIRFGWVRSVNEFNRLAKTRFESLTLDGAAPTGEKTLLLMPMTFMNLSGRSVQSAMSFYQLTPDDVMIVLDDIALPCGKIRLRSGGSSGGHNGLKSIEQSLGTSQYPRLRIGIDPPPQFVPQPDYVLGRFSPDQRKQLDNAIPRACEAIEMWMKDGVGKAMSLYNAEVDTRDQKKSE